VSLFFCKVWSFLYNKVVCGRSVRRNDLLSQVLRVPFQASRYAGGVGWAVRPDDERPGSPDVLSQRIGRMGMPVFGVP
jgi:hypothetical protein